MTVDIYNFVEYESTLRRVLHPHKKFREFFAAAIFRNCKVIRASLFHETVKRIMRSVDGGVFLYHTNFTFTQTFPVRRDALNSVLAQKGIKTLNATAFDISKRTIQQFCARLGNPSLTAGPVGNDDQKLFVKSNFNFGGEPEARLKRRVPRLGIPTPKVMVKSEGYKMMRRDEIPREWWHTPEVHIERFISNPEEAYYRAYLLGQRVVVSKIINTAVVKKSRDKLMRWNYPQDAPEVIEIAKLVLALSKSMGLDFGTMDVLEDDEGRHYICDVNATPYWGGGAHEGTQTPKMTSEDMVEYLREGNPAWC